MRTVFPPRAILVSLLLLGLCFPAAVEAQGASIERIEVRGLFRMSEEAFLHAFGVQVGDPYDEAFLRARFRSLWRRQLFEDITIESETTSTGGKLLVVTVRERPVLSSVTYEDNRIVTRTQIEDRYKEREIRLGLGKPIDMGQVFFAEAAIRDLLAEKGYLDARVTADVKTVTEKSRSLYFAIVPGGKTRIRRIDFTGNELFSDRKLKSELKLTQERKWYWPWSGKNLYHPVKWDQDIGGIRELYQHRGHLDVEVRAPVVEVRAGGGAEKKREKAAAERARHEARLEELQRGAEAAAEGQDELTDKQRAKRAAKRQKQEDQARRKARRAEASQGKRWVHLAVPITEGPQYTLGEITFKGNEVFDSVLLRALIPMRPSQVLSNSSLEFGVNRITRLYEDRGHLYANVVRRINRRDEGNVADVEVEVDEDEPYYVGRIEFRGNTRTHDRVLRRELQLMEGDLFSRSRLDRSRAKVNQLGYFQVADEPVIEPIADEKRIRVVFSGEEQGRNEIQIGGGYSGLDGAFFNGVYSTRNFLGRGQVLSTSLQVGGRQDLYQISFQEPWFLGRPYLLGVAVFRRNLDFGGTLRSTSSGGGVTIGKRLTPSSRLSVGYNYESVSSSSFVNTGTIETFRTENEISSITPIFAFSTVNNPYRPSRGKAFNISMQIAGGTCDRPALRVDREGGSPLSVPLQLESCRPLGGNSSYIKPLATFTWYKRAWGRSHLALNVEAGFVQTFSEDDFSDFADLLPSSGIDVFDLGLATAVQPATDVRGVPRFQRFWLGGDTLGPRIFETRSITPLRYVVRDAFNRWVDVVGDPRFRSPTDVISAGGIPVPIEVGGDRMFLVQTEWVLPLNEQADLAFFVDAGDALFEDTPLDLSTVRVAAGVELRFHLPIFPVPLRLIYGVPVRELEGDRTSNFTFSIGRSF